MLSYAYSIYILSFVSGVYSGFSKFTLSMWLRDAGGDLLLLNLFTMTMFPSVFSALWLPFLENYSVPWLTFGIKKKLIFVCDGIILIMTAFLPLFKIQNASNLSNILLILFLILYACVIVSRDVISIGYKMEFIERSKVAEYDGIISAYYQAGLMLGGVGLFALSGYSFPWSTIFLMLCLMLCANLILTLFITNSSYQTQQKLSFFERFSTPYRDLINKNKQVLPFLIAFIIFGSLADRLLAGNLNYYVLDEGLSKLRMSQLKILTGIFSMVVGVASVYLVKWLGLNTLLLLSTILYGLVPILIFINLKWHWFIDYHQNWLICVVIMDKIFKALQGSIFFSYKMQFCTPEFASSQKAIFFFFERGLSSFLSPFIGFVLREYGYVWFFGAVSFAIIPAVISILWLLKIRRIK